jgi:ankyrin repeat protein
MTPEEANEKLFAAAVRGNLAAVQAALPRGADPNARDSYLETPLHAAAAHTEVARLLIGRFPITAVHS